MTERRRHLTIMAIWAALLAVAAVGLWGWLFPDGGDAAATDTSNLSPPPTVCSPPSVRNHR